MTVLLTGSTLTLDDVARVARDAERVELAPEAVERMLARRAIVERVSSEGTPAYGVTTGVGMRRDASVDAREAAAFNRSAILGHLVGLGPSTSEEVVRAALVCHANGLVAGVVQDARTSDLIFTVPSLVAELSAVLPLLPGDVIFTGTPAGVGMARQPPRALQAGQVLESWIEGIGTIRNRCV